MKIKATDKGLKFTLDAEELSALIAEIQAGYNAAVKHGVPAYHPEGQLAKLPIETLLINLVYEGLVKLRKKLAEGLWDNNVTISIHEACAMWEFWECGLITYKIQNQWSVNFITNTFGTLHPLLTC
jgi:hypothetical protein